MAASVTIPHGHANKDLPIRVPHLMPFHIQHTGPAPVSTYFRIRPSLLSSVSGPSTTPVVDTEIAAEEKENASLAAADVVAPATATAETEVVAKSTASRVLRTSAIARLADSAKRFVSSFRGRTVHGVEVALPDGYVGIVLRGDAHGKAHQTTASHSKRHPNRSRELRRKSDLVEDVQYLDDAAKVSPEDGRPVRVLKPAARFDSFVLWHPDIAVDEGKDEYLRSLSEWVNIAAEVRPRKLIRVDPSSPDDALRTGSQKRASSDIDIRIQWAALCITTCYNQFPSSFLFICVS